MNRIYWISLAALLLMSCNQPTLHLESKRGERVSFTVEIADEAAERQQGLMHREALDEGTGMLFVFEETKHLSFWMKNTLIPLDILYFSQTGGLVSWTTMQPCQADPCPSYPSQGLARYALEVPAGTIEEQGITWGWRLVLD